MKELINKIVLFAEQTLTRLHLIKYRDFIFYVTIGFTGLFLDFLTFIVLVKVAGVSVFISNTISMTVGIVNNYFLNAFFNFKKTDQLFRRFLLFYAVGLFGILLSNIVIFLLYDKLGLWLEGVKAFSIVLVAVIQFFLNRALSFGDIQKNKSSNQKNE